MEPLDSPYLNNFKQVCELVTDVQAAMSTAVAALGALRDTQTQTEHPVINDEAMQQLARVRDALQGGYGTVTAVFEGLQALGDTLAEAAMRQMGEQ